MELWRHRYRALHVATLCTLMKANHGPMVHELPPKTCRCIFDAFVIDKSKLAHEPVVLYVIEKTKSAVCSKHTVRLIEIDPLIVCLSKRPLWLGWSVEIQHAALIVMRFVVRLRKSLRSNQFRCARIFSATPKDICQSAKSGSFNTRECRIYCVLLQVCS